MPFALKLPRSGLCAAAAVLGFAALSAVPAVAQEVEELTVVGSFGPDGRPNTLSRVVNIADLDLTTPAGVDAMRGRIRDAARDVCRELGETASGPTLGRSCVTSAVASADEQMRLAIDSARSRPIYAEAPPAPAYVAPTGETADVSATVPAAPAEPTYTVTTVTNGPVPDTPENRARFGGPMSNGGQKTAPVGN